MLKQGDKAPNFTLVNTDKQEVTLTQYEGKNVVLLFFPLAFTGVCTAELCGVRDDISNYNQMNAEVLGISVDSPFALGAFKDKENYNFQLLSDFNKTVSAAYGSLYETFAFGMAGVSKRSAFVIDKTGTIQYAEVLENAGDVPNLAKIKELLATLN
ncbi:MAG: redoxin domain-containing protein [Bacteroidia bacterium]|jgi:peroxiredoxin